MSNDIVFSGLGSVSPAGWSVNDLVEAVEKGIPLTIGEDRRSEDAPLRRFRRVPALAVIPNWLKQPRMRRTTLVARYAVHSMVEALGEARLQKVQAGELKLGVIFCTMNGCVQFSRRFYAEVLENPMFASPILFPETVYNAPSSHLSSLLGSKEMNYTLVGDSAQFIGGIELAAQWLEDKLVDGCLVVTAEESDWLFDEALMLYGKDRIAAEGAATVFLERGDENVSAKVRLEAISDAQTFSNVLSREAAAAKVQAELAPLISENVVLCDGLGMGGRADRAEVRAWTDWKGARRSIRPIIGEGFAISSGWQTVVACSLLEAGTFDQAVVSAVGLSQQAVGLILEKR